MNNKEDNHKKVNICIKKWILTKRDRKQITIFEKKVCRGNFFPSICQWKIKLENIK
jgi:hypothetical protein